MYKTRSERASTFTYAGFHLDPAGLLTCTYDLDGETFEERFDCGVVPGGDFATPAALAAARLVFLLAGVSYYKAGAARTIVVPDGLGKAERLLLRDVYLHGLAEYAYTSGLDLSDVRIEAPARSEAPVAATTGTGRPLIPFGGGIDSIVVVDETRRREPDAVLFVVSTSDVLFEPIESTAALTGLPVLRARRHLDDKILASWARGYYDGHVPVTGILSAVAVLLAVAHGRDSVVMSNEHSASEPTDLVANGVRVNHQWSKGEHFETDFRAVLAGSITGVDYYSALRPYSELWVSRRFAELGPFHREFRSCNRAFHIDPSQRLDRWCGTCDKCAFIDLILAPYLDRADLEAIFAGTEPLADPELEPVFHSLLGDAASSKPLECVGDFDECRRAVVLAAARPDRETTAGLRRLRAYVEDLAVEVPTEAALLEVMGAHNLPASATR